MNREASALHHNLLNMQYNGEANEGHPEIASFMLHCKSTEGVLKPGMYPNNDSSFFPQYKEEMPWDESSPWGESSDDDSPKIRDMGRDDSPTQGYSSPRLKEEKRSKT